MGAFSIWNPVLLVALEINKRREKGNSYRAPVSVHPLVSLAGSLPGLWVLCRAQDPVSQPFSLLVVGAEEVCLTQALGNKL